MRQGVGGDYNWCWIMDFFELKAYRQLAEVLDKQRSIKANLIIASLPGVGASFFLKKYREQKKDDRVAYITGLGQETAEFNLVDVDFETNEEALGWAEQYLKMAVTEEKFAVVVNAPSVLEGKDFSQSYLGRHAYSTYYLGFQDREAVEELAWRMGIELSPEVTDRVWRLTGGVGRWAKYVLSHLDMTNKGVGEMLEEGVLRRMVEPLACEVQRCGQPMLEKLGVIKEGKVQAELLVAYMQKFGAELKNGLEVGPDLVVMEDGQSGEELLKIEAEVVKYIQGHGGVIEKEKVAEFKWGEGGYDKFSDQAVNKTMRRLDKKLKRHKIETISGYGFKLVRR